MFDLKFRKLADFFTYYEEEQDIGYYIEAHN
jgi:hypothetical protein